MKGPDPAAPGAAWALSEVTAAILAGGLGTRLRSVVNDRPKVLADVRGRPFLAYLFDQVATAGVRFVVLCTGYRGDQVRAAFGDAYGPLSLAYSHEPAPLGTAGALRLALPLLKSDPVPIMNGDSFCGEDLGALWAWHQARAAAGTLLLTEAADTRRYGRVRVDDAGVVRAFEEKGGDRGPGWINAGVYLLSQRVLRTIPANGAVSLEREVFRMWVGRGLYGYRSPAPLWDIGTPDTYAKADEFFLPEEPTRRGRARRGLP